MKTPCLIIYLFTAIVSTPIYGQTPRLLDAIEEVESGGHGVNTPDGDGGKAIGPFQIHRAYWQDATEHDKSIGGKYEDCRDPIYARKVVVAYLDRYAKGKTEEEMARIHNGGPKGHLKKATEKYWIKVKNILK